MAVIQLESVGKRYWLQHRAPDRRLIEVLQQSASSLARRFRGQSVTTTSPREEFWALRDVNLQIDQGEVVGLIGRNGAGKSTLLKLISWIMAPTTGRVGVRGRLGCLLEVGSGFHPELTGRENVFLNGAILGMSLREIQRKFDQIVAFSEVEAFLDTPVKHFSSGMFVRLAFAVAAFLEPEILIVDEVLAVGDTAFQQKCLAAIRESVGRGCTCILVSHHLPSITSLCRRALLLEHGRLVADGPPDDVVRRYLETNLQSSGLQTFDDMPAPSAASARLLSLRLWQQSPAQPTAEIALNQELVVDLEWELLEPLEGITVTLQVRDASGAIVCMSSSAEQELLNDDATAALRLAGRYRARCRVPPQLLNEGRYSVSVFVGRGVGHPIVSRIDAISFQTHEVGPLRALYPGLWPGVVRPHLPWEISELDHSGQ